MEMVGDILENLISAVIKPDEEPEKSPVDKELVLPRGKSLLSELEQIIDYIKDVQDDIRENYHKANPKERLYINESYGLLVNAHKQISGITGQFEFFFLKLDQ